MEILEAPEMLAMEEMLIVITALTFLITRPPLPRPIVVIFAPKIFSIEEMIIVIATFCPLFRGSPVPYAAVLKEIPDVQEVFNTEKKVLVFTTDNTLLIKSSYSSSIRNRGHSRKKQQTGLGNNNKLN